APDRAVDQRARSVRHRPRARARGGPRARLRDGVERTARPARSRRPRLPSREGGRRQDRDLDRRTPRRGPRTGALRRGPGAARLARAGRRREYRAAGGAQARAAAGALSFLAAADVVKFHVPPGPGARLPANAEHAMKITFKVNGESRSLEADPEMPLLWALRDLLGLKGAKYGCGVGACGACTVHVNGRAMRSCAVPLKAVQGDEIRTIEGLGGNHPVQQAWLEEQVPQCGYCQTGQIMQAVALLEKTPQPSSEQIR